MNHMDKELLERFRAQGKKLDEIGESLERMRRYFFWKFVVTVIIIILPIIGASFLIPKLLSNVCESLGF